MTPDLTAWIGGTMTGPDGTVTEFCGVRWANNCCAFVPAPYLIGRAFSIDVGSPWRVEQPSDAVLLIYGTWPGHVRLERI